MPGLLIASHEIEVPGVQIINPHDADWARLNARDCRPRPTRWVRQVVQHTTKGEWPQVIKPGAGPGGRDRRVADFWNESERQSAAHIVTDSDGSGACLADLLAIEAYHATRVNKWSVGFETYQEQHGVIYQAAIDSTVRMTIAVCRALGIQFQVPKLAYHGKPLERVRHDGGPDLVGIIGHRDVTDHRGKGDPGEAIMAAMVKAGAEQFDFDTREDIAIWKERQTALKAAGHYHGKVDGVAGPATVAALKIAGHPDGLWVQPIAP